MAYKRVEDPPAYLATVKQGPLLSLEFSHVPGIYQILSSFEFVMIIMIFANCQIGKKYHQSSSFLIFLQLVLSSTLAGSLY